MYFFLSYRALHMSYHDSIFETLNKISYQLSLQGELARRLVSKFSYLGIDLQLI